MQYVINLAKHFHNDSLYRNSIYLMMSTFIMAILGFIFWIVTARLFSASDVGLATTIITAITQLSAYSLLGLNNGLIRFLPLTKDRSEMINSSILLVVISSIIISIIFIIGIPLFSKELFFFRNNYSFAIFFTIILVINSLNIILESIFNVFRSGGFILVKNTSWAILKLIFPLIFIGLGSIGIFASYSLSMVICVGIFLVILFIKYNLNFKFKINFIFIKNLAQFSFATYLANLLWSLPFLFLPILITNRLGPNQTAYYYMCMMMANFLFIIPQAATRSLFVEVSYLEVDIKAITFKAIKIIGIFLIPSIIGIFIFGKYILLTFGKEYSSSGLVLLYLLTLSSLFLAVSSISNILLMLKHQLKIIIYINFIWLLMLISLSYYFIDLGLLGIGISWLISQIFICILFVYFTFKQFKSYFFN